MTATTTATIRPYAPTSFRAAGGAGRVRGVTSTENLARDGAILDAAGWDSRDYPRNPVVLWAHDDSSGGALLGKDARLSSRSVPAADLEAWVRDRIADALAHARRLLAELRRISGGKTQAAKVASLRKRLDDARVQRSRLLDLYVEGAIAKLEFDKRASTLNDR